MYGLNLTVGISLIVLTAGAIAQDPSARTVQYHSQDIIPIRAKVKYTTLIEVPATEKIMEAATGDKDFWIVDVVGNFCFVHPAKPGISSNLNLITDKGNIYSFTLQDVSALGSEPDLKVLVEPADVSALGALRVHWQWRPGMGGEIFCGPQRERCPRSSVPLRRVVTRRIHRVFRPA